MVPCSSLTLCGVNSGLHISDVAVLLVHTSAGEAVIGAGELLPVPENVSAFAPAPSVPLPLPSSFRPHGKLRPIKW